MRKMMQRAVLYRELTYVDNETLVQVLGVFEDASEAIKHFRVLSGKYRSYLQPIGESVGLAFDPTTYYSSIQYWQTEDLAECAEWLAAYEAENFGVTHVVGSDSYVSSNSPIAAEILRDFSIEYVVQLAGYHLAGYPE